MMAVWGRRANPHNESTCIVADFPHFIPHCCLQLYNEAKVSIKRVPYEIVHMPANITSGILLQVFEDESRT
jgi:hypothetical protein